jgi:hypothetical protein
MDRQMYNVDVYKRKTRKTYTNVLAKWLSLVGELTLKITYLYFLII